MSMMSFLKKLVSIPRKIWGWCKRVAGFFFNHRKEVEESGKAVGAAATAITASMAVVKAMKSVFHVHGKGKKTTETKKTNKPTMDSKGKVSRVRSDDKPVRKTKKVEEEFRQELNERSDFVQAFDPEERKEVIEERAKSRGTQPYDMKSQNFHQWNVNKSVLWNEVEEVKAYAKVKMDYTDDAEERNAQRTILNMYLKAYFKAHPNHIKTNISTKDILKVERDDILQAIRDDFDERVKAQMYNFEDEEEDYSENPMLGEQWLAM